MKKIILPAFALFCVTVSSYAQTGVFVAPVVKKDIADVVESIGTAKAYESVIITSDTTKKVTGIHFEEGDKVQTGSLLFTLNKQEEEADLAAAQSSYIEKKKAYERAKQLKADGVISNAVYQERKAAYETEEAGVAAVKARIALKEIRAPFSGTVGILDISVGALVQPGTVMTSLDDLSRMKLDFNVPSRYLSTLKVGDTVEAKTDAYTETFKSTVSYIDTRVDPITRSVRVRSIVPNENNLLKEGMLMKVKAFTNSRPAMTIPEEALIKRGEQDFVFKVGEKDGQSVAVEQEVQIGQRSRGVVEILDGLAEGEQVIHHGVLKVRNGTPIKIRAVEDEDKHLQQMLKEGAK